MFRHTEDASLGEGSLGHPSEDLQVLVEVVSAVFGRNKLLLTPLDQSLLQHLHAGSLQPRNLGRTQNIHPGCRQWRVVNTWARVLPPVLPFQKCVQTQPLLRSSPPPSDEYGECLSVIIFYVSVGTWMTPAVISLDLFRQNVTDTCWSEASRAQMYQ